MIFAGKWVELENVALSEVTLVKNSELDFCEPLQQIIA